MRFGEDKNFTSKANKPCENILLVITRQGEKKLS